MRAPRVLFLLAVSAVATLSFPRNARAADKATCAAAAVEGQRLRKEHKLVAARDQLLVCSSPDCPEIVTQDCTPWLGEVERSVASVVFRPVDEHGRPLDGVRVTENGVVVAEQAGLRAVEVDPGAHTFHFERDGYRAADQGAQLEEGRRNQEIAVTMRPDETAPPPPPPPVVHETSGSGAGLLVGAVVATTLAVAGGGVFAGFGFSGLSDQDALRKSCAPYCTSAQTSPVQTEFTIADVALVSGLVALAVAGAFWVVWGTRAPAKHVGLAGATFEF